MLLNRRVPARQPASFLSANEKEAKKWLLGAALGMSIAGFCAVNGRDAQDGFYRQP